VQIDPTNTYLESASRVTQRLKIRRDDLLLKFCIHIQLAPLRAGDSAVARRARRPQDAVQQVWVAPAKTQESGGGGGGGHNCGSFGGGGGGSRD
jgi:hypothetical protein